MSDELRKDEEPEVEGHVRHQQNEEPSDENETETEDEVEAHVRKSSPRHI